MHEPEGTTIANIFLDIGSGYVGTSSFIPAALTTTTNGTFVDLSDSNANMASAVAEFGAVSGTQGTLDIKITECATTNGTYTDIPGASFTQQTTSGVAGTSGFQIISFQRNKRYVRAYATMAGTFTTFLFGVGIFAQRATQPDATGGWANEAGAS